MESIHSASPFEIRGYIYGKPDLDLINYIQRKLNYLDILMGPFDVGPKN
jgi:hypothetical protein